MIVKYSMLKKAGICDDGINKWLDRNNVTRAKLARVGVDTSDPMYSNDRMVKVAIRAINKKA